MKDEGDLEPQAVIGPNAILNCAPALRAVGGDDLARRLYAEAGVLDMLDHPPQRMVPQTEVAALHRAIATGLPPETADRVRNRCVWEMAPWG